MWTKSLTGEQVAISLKRFILQYRTILKKPFSYFTPFSLKFVPRVSRAPSLQRWSTALLRVLLRCIFRKQPAIMRSFQKGKGERKLPPPFHPKQTYIKRMPDRRYSKTLFTRRNIIRSKLFTLIIKNVTLPDYYHPWEQHFLMWGESF